MEQGPQRQTIGQDADIDEKFSCGIGLAAELDQVGTQQARHTGTICHVEAKASGSFQLLRRMQQQQATLEFLPRGDTNHVQMVQSPQSEAEL